MTLEEAVWSIVLIFFALPIALSALVYLWRFLVDIFIGSKRQRDEVEHLECLSSEDESNEEFRS